MRKLILVTFILTIVSCNKKIDSKKNKWNDSIIVYSQEEMIKIQLGMIKVVDTACINEEKRAYKDIRNGKLIYYIFTGMTKMYRSNKEMKEVLLKYKIQTDSTTTSCIPPPKGFRTNCYISIMNKEIEKRHGKKFIESVRNEAEGKYAIRHLNMVFEFDECDTISRYPGTKNYKDFFEKPYVDFEKTFKYPKNYKFESNKQKSTTVVEFVLTKAGLVKNVSTDVRLNDTENSKYEDYFRKNAEEFVKTVKWVPATKGGIKVDSKLHFWYVHK